MFSHDQTINTIEGGADERLPKALFDQFLARSRTMVVGKGEIVVVEGAQNRDVFLILDGELRVVLSSSDGREVILRQIVRGNIFGEMAAIDAQPRSARVVAISTCTLSVMPGDEFLEFLAEVPRAGLWMTQQMSARVRDLTEKTYALALLPTSTRIHAELLRLARKAVGFKDGSEEVELQSFPTHADIAARIGTHREGVSRELSQLAKEGIIEQRGRILMILSLSGLRSLYDRIGK